MVINTFTFEISAYGEIFIIMFSHNGKGQYDVIVKVKGINNYFYEYQTEKVKTITGSTAILVLEQALLKYPRFKKQNN